MPPALRLTSHLWSPPLPTQASRWMCAGHLGQTATTSRPTRYWCTNEVTAANFSCTRWSTWQQTQFRWCSGRSVPWWALNHSVVPIIHYVHTYSVWQYDFCLYEMIVEWNNRFRSVICRTVQHTLRRTEEKSNEILCNHLERLGYNCKEASQMLGTFFQHLFLHSSWNRYKRFVRFPYNGLYNGWIVS